MPDIMTNNIGLNVTPDNASGVTFNQWRNATDVKNIENLQKIDAEIGQIKNDYSNEPHYDGVDLTVEFADEIAAAPYSGDVWAWIKARITAVNYTGIHINDYIPFTATNGNVVKACVAGIDTYYRYGNPAVGHHIDFISRDCWDATVQMNLVNYNNGLSGISYPWLVSNAYAFLNSLSMAIPNGTAVNPVTEQVDYTAGGIWYYLPDALKSVIIEKRALLPMRYNAAGLLTSDNNWDWANAGKLWLPSEVEIAGCPIWGDKGYGAGGFVQYPIFAQNMNRVKGLGNGGSRYSWWTVSACSGDNASFAIVYNRGRMNISNASAAFGAPVCFRIA